ncbi:MAG: helix-turn-helix transcriptional regulator [Pseudomonadota bacterium]
MTLQQERKPETAAMKREIHARQGLGAAAHVVQASGLEVHRIHVTQAALIFVDRGDKSVCTGKGALVRATPGQAIVLSSNQSLDFTNAVQDGSYYEARWLLFDPVLLDDAYYCHLRQQQYGSEIRGRAAQATCLLPQVSEGLREAYVRAAAGLDTASKIPVAVARQRMLEVMHWLLDEGVVLHHAPHDSSTSLKVRGLLAGSLDDNWTGRRIAGELAMSEASLRRKLATEGNTLTGLLLDARMSTALTLLQATTQPVSQIALSVGYESASRFAIRFRQRFGFAPTTVRGHERAN